METILISDLVIDYRGSRLGKWLHLSGSIELLGLPGGTRHFLGMPRWEDTSTEDCKACQPVHLAARSGDFSPRHGPGAPLNR